MLLIFCKVFKNKFRLNNKIIKKYNSSRKLENYELPICLAPFKSLRFMPNGDINVCCHNNSYVLGRYPQNNIKEVWEGDKLKKLRKSISKADFSLGCQVCLDAFESGDFESVNPLLYEDFDQKKDQPVILDFKIATECNLECVMCSEYSSSAIRAKNDIAFKDLYDENFINQIKNFIPEIKAARFSGGEPFLNKIYYKLWDIIIKRNNDCEIYIQTNGTILNEKIKNLLEQGKFFINVSIDAVNPELYSKIRVNGDFNKLKSNIEFFSEYSQRNNRKLGITACAMKDNLAELPKIVEFANKYNAEIWFSEVYFPFWNALWTQKSEFIRKNLLELEKYNFEIHNSIAAKNHKIYQNLINRINNTLRITENIEKNTKYFIKTEKLLLKLKKIYITHCFNDLQDFIKIEKAINRLGDVFIYDFTLEFSKFYDKKYIFQQLNFYSEDKLFRNFEILTKNFRY